LLEDVVVTQVLGGHEVRTVRHVTYYTISFPGFSAKPSPFEEFQMVDNHFFCESYDATQPFPVSSASAPDDGFLWNAAWRDPFVRLSIPDVCVCLLQGVCRTSDLVGVDFQITYIARRSVLNPGTRYAARGLNDRNSPGNEVECELIFVRGRNFWTVRWRRGSIPIRWRTTLHSSLAAPQHKVDADYFKGTAEYFRSLRDRFGSAIPIRIVSLLETEDDHAEGEIKNYFTLALSQLNSAGVSNVFFAPFDLNHHLHSDGSGEAMMDFVSFLGPLVESDGFTTGDLPGEVRTRQAGLMRFNCADSLDRTNLATFYFAMRVASEWCRAQGVGIANPDADANQPHLVLDQAVVNFLASAFVDSGNVISFLYTNTPAIKIGAIRRFSPTVNVQASDTSVTMQRRLQNVVNDPQRMRVIESWTNPPSLSWQHRIDPRHAAVVPTSHSLPRAVLAEDCKCLRLSAEQREIVVCLPCPMHLIGVHFLLYPGAEVAAAVAIEAGPTIGGMETVAEIALPIVTAALWCRFRLSRANWWGLGSRPRGGYARFVRFAFAVRTDAWQIGQIRLEVRSPFGRERPLRPPEMRETDEATIARFEAAVDAFLESPRAVANVLQLERERITMRVGEKRLLEAMLTRGVNPWVADSCAQLIARRGGCLICGNSEPPDPVSFEQSRILPGLLQATDKRTRLQMCAGCSEAGEDIARIAELYQDENADVAGEVPLFETGMIDLERLLTNQALTSDSSAAFLCGGDQALLRREGGKFLIAPHSVEQFVLYIIQHAIVLEIWIEADIDAFVLRGPDGVEITKREQEDGVLSYPLPTPQIMQTVEFSLETDDAQVVIRKIQVLYIITEFPFELSPTITAAPIHWKKCKAVGTFASVDRTDTIKFTRSRIARFRLDIITEKGKRPPLSFVFAALLEGKMVFRKHYVLPELDNGKRIWYQLDEAVEADAVKVFYLDRCPDMRPHCIRVSFE
jgi:hypothetical protein